MRKVWFAWLVLFVVISFVSASAEEIKFSTYYPAPAGVYKEMNVNYLDFKSDVYQEAFVTNLPDVEEGRLFYDQDTKSIKYYDGTSWQPLAGYWTKTGTDIYYTDGIVGIGTTSSLAFLNVYGGLQVERTITANGPVDMKSTLYILDYGNGGFALSKRQDSCISGWATIACDSGGSGTWCLCMASN